MKSEDKPKDDTHVCSACGTDHAKPDLARRAAHLALRDLIDKAPRWRPLRRSRLSLGARRSVALVLMLVGVFPLALISLPVWMLGFEMPAATFIQWLNKWVEADDA